MILNAVVNFFNRSTTPNNSTGQRLVYVPMRKGGIYVDHETANNFSAVWACSRFISQSVAQLPWHVRRRRDNGGSDPAATHPVDQLISTRPCPEISAFQWKAAMSAWAVSWGNAYAEIEKDLAGRPTALWPLSPDRVTPMRGEDGRLVYEVLNYRGPKTYLEPDQVFHIAGLGYDGIKGYSVISLAAASIGAGIAADEFAASFYANGAVMSGGLKTENKLADETYQRLKKDFNEKFVGPQKSWRPIILEHGLDWVPFGMPLKDAEFLGSQKFRVQDIARWFGVPPHKIGDLERATFSNIEHQAIETVTDTIVPWVIRFEQEADYKLISPRNRGIFFTKMKLQGLMRGDHASRAAFYKDMRNCGVFSVDEIREREDENPIGPAKGGNKYVMQGQYVTLDKIGEEPVPQPGPPQADDGEKNAASETGTE